MSTIQVANVYLESTANNRIQYNGSNVFSLYAGGAQILTVNSTAANVVTNTFNLGTSIKAANGYTYLPNGLIFQWFTVPTISTSTAATYTFPITFPTAALSITTGGTATTIKLNGSNTSALTANAVGAGSASFMVIGN